MRYMADENGILYLCATPIGNLGDVSERCLEILKSVDLIAAEDTRRTLQLLNHFGITKALTSYHEHNKKAKGEYIVKLLKEGKNVAQVSDAGTPAISDPGEDLVRLCIENGITVTSVPGPVAGITALILSGLPTGRYAFEGFLSVNKRHRHEHLNAVKNDPRTLIFYEAPHKLKTTLSDKMCIRDSCIGPVIEYVSHYGMLGLELFKDLRFCGIPVFGFLAARQPEFFEQDNAELFR